MGGRIGPQDYKQWVGGGSKRPRGTYLRIETREEKGPPGEAERVTKGRYLEGETIGLEPTILMDIEGLRISRASACSRQTSCQSW